MKVLASPENKNLYSEKEIKQFIGLYHLGAINPTDDPVLTAVVLQAIYEQNEGTEEKKPLTTNEKIAKYVIIFVFCLICLGLALVMLYISSKYILKLY